MEIFTALLVVLLALVCWQYQRIRRMLDQETSKNLKLEKTVETYKEYVDYVDGVNDLMDRKDRYVLSMKDYIKMINK